MAYTQTELDALKAALASGALTVSYDGGKSVTYGGVNDLLRRIRVVEAEMAAAAGKAKPVAGFAGFRRL